VGKGLSLSEALLISETGAGSNFEIRFDTVYNILATEGLTRLCNDVFFNILSTYDGTTGVGSQINDLIGAPLMFNEDKNLAVVQIVDELADVQERFIQFQKSGTRTVPAEEQLLQITIRSIVAEPSTSSVLLELEITNILGQRASFRI
jgi:hypothetical protein